MFGFGVLLLLGCIGGRDLLRVFAIIIRIYWVYFVCLCITIFLFVFVLLLHTPQG